MARDALKHKRTDDTNGLQSDPDADRECILHAVSPEECIR